VRAAFEEWGSGLPVKSLQVSLRVALQGTRLFACITEIHTNNNDNAALLIYYKYNSNLIQIDRNRFLKFSKIGRSR
jgi:hypothetical protein